MTMLLSELIAAHARGDVDREAGELLSEVSEAVALLQKKGSVTVTLSLESAGGRILVGVEVTSKKPKPAPEAEMYFNTPTGLSKQDSLFNPGAPVLRNEHYEHPAGRGLPVALPDDDGVPQAIDTATGEIVRLDPDNQENQQ